MRTLISLHRVWPTRLSAIAITLLALHQPAFADFKSLESKTDRWIQLELKTAESQSDWQSSKIVLEQNLKVLETALHGLETERQVFSKASHKKSQMAEESKQSIIQETQRRDAISHSLDNVQERLDLLKDAFPDFLNEELASTLERVAKTDKDDVSERARLIISALKRLEEFNSRFTVEHTVKTLDNGDAIVTRILYCGLAGGYAVNNDASLAWQLVPSSNGWLWNDATEDASKIRQLIEIHEQRQPPELVSVNAQTQDIKQAQQ